MTSPELAEEVLDDLELLRARDPRGLLPAVAQDADTKQVLMLAWMNREAYEETLRTRRAVYFSRSRNRLWRKGEERGNVQEVHAVYLDCDADTILLEVRQIGGAACLALVAGYPVIPPALARTVVAVNALCAVGCVVTAFAGFVPLNGFGVVFLLIGALIVTVYTALQYTGLRRMTAAPSAR